MIVEGAKINPECDYLECSYSNETCNDICEVKIHDLEKYS